MAGVTQTQAKYFRCRPLAHGGLTLGSFKTINFGETSVRNKAGLNSFKISVKDWVAKTNAIGLTAKAGRYGGTYAHKDLAFEFGEKKGDRFIYKIKGNATLFY